MKPKLSILVAAHHEGLIAHKTMLSLDLATQRLTEANITYEVIVTVDNGDKDTQEYFSRYAGNNLISVHEISFGELSASRNYGVSLAKGDFIATLDADDLVSENWLIEGLNLLVELKNNAVIHTHFSVNFGTQDVVWEKFNSRSKEEDAIIMTWANRWDSAILAPREVFEKFPYQPNNGGYGSEDWHFNSQTLAAGIAHKVAPTTVLFVRRKDISMMTTQAADRRTVRYTNLLDFDFLKTINTALYEDIEQHSAINEVSTLANRAISLTKGGLRYVHTKAKTNPTYRRSTKKLISALKIRKGSSSLRFPDWLMHEWLSIHKIDKAIFPDEQLVKTISLYHSEMYELGITLVKLSKHLTRQPDYIIFVPHLTKGGAELVAMNYVRAIRKVYPQWHIAVVATELGENPWRSQLPNDVDFIPYGEYTHHLPEQLRLQLLARFIVQSKATHLHIAQSPLMFRFAELYQTLLNAYTCYAFAFCEDIDNQGRIAGHVHSGLPYAYGAIDKIFTDCTAIATSLMIEYGYDNSKFITHYQPITTAITLARARAESNTPLKVLWASRIAKQKRPDVLVAIGKQLKQSNILIDAYGSFQDGFTHEIFDDMDAISYKGHFDGIDSIPTDNYDVFLYTSENDGIPNIILEASAKGLAVIAPDVGGISEFIADTTGILIDKTDNVKAYLAALKHLNTDDQARLNLIGSAQRKLTTQHSTVKFEKSILKDIT